MHRYPDAARSRVVLIGTSDFELPDKLPNLPGVRGNLSGLERALTDPVRGVFDEAACLVIDSPDTARSMLGRLSRAAEQAEDVLVVYYAGHGTLDASGALHLAVRETDPGPYQVGATAVPFAVVRRVIEDSPARLRVLILDCCFSGRAVGAMAAETAALDQIDASGTYVLTSTEANRIALAVAGERYTAFTGALLDLLTGRHDPAELTLDQLQRELRAGLARAGMPRPMSRADDTAGSLVIRRRGDAAPPKRPIESRDRPVVKPFPKPNPKPLVKPIRPADTPVGTRRSSETVQWVLFVFCVALTITGITQAVSPQPGDTSSPASNIAVAVVFAGLTVWLGWRLYQIQRRKRGKEARR